MKNTRKTPVQYVSNEKFYLELIRYKALLKEYDEKGFTPPPIPEYIGVCILSIAKKLSNKSNFIGYSSQWKDEMISDGIENCILYLNNFNPDKTNNPFAYFTQIIWYAFIRRIEKEKKQQVIKAKNLQNYAIFDSLNEEFQTDSAQPNEALNDLITTYEKIKTKKRPDKKSIGLEKFTDED